MYLHFLHQSLRLSIYTRRHVDDDVSALLKADHRDPATNHDWKYRMYSEICCTFPVDVLVEATDAAVVTLRLASVQEWYLAIAVDNSVQLLPMAMLTIVVAAVAAAVGADDLLSIVASVVYYCSNYCRQQFQYCSRDDVLDDK